MLMRRLQGDSIRQIQERFNVSRATVGRNLEKARKKAYLQLGQELIVTELFPSAIGAVKAAIEQGELDLAANTALRLLEGMHILGRHAQGPAADEGVTVEESFEAIRRRIVRRVEVAADDIDDIDAEVVPNEHAPINHRPQLASPADSNPDFRGVQSDMPGSAGAGLRDPSNILSDSDSPDAEEGSRLYAERDEAAGPFRPEEQDVEPLTPEVEAVDG
jgi:hypothetical protein